MQGRLEQADSYKISADLEGNYDRITGDINTDHARECSQSRDQRFL